MSEPTNEFGIERLIPPWSTNPDLPPGQPYADGRVDGRYRSRRLAELVASEWEPGTWRIMVRHVSAWTVAADDTPTYDPAAVKAWAESRQR